MTVRLTMIKEEDKDIIRSLRTGKRMNISSIARDLQLPTSTVSDRVRRIENKYITKRVSLLDYQKAGYLAHEVLALKVHPRQRPALLDFLKTQKCANSVYFLNSAFNFLVEIICKDYLDLKAWIDNLKSRFHPEIMSFQIVKTEKKEAFLPQ